MTVSVLARSRPQRESTFAVLPAATVRMIVIPSNRGSSSSAARPLRSGLRSAQSASTIGEASSGTSARESACTAVPGAAISVVVVVCATSIARRVFPTPGRAFDHADLRPRIRAPGLSRYGYVSSERRAAFSDEHYVMLHSALGQSSCGPSASRAVQA